MAKLDRCGCSLEQDEAKRERAERLARRLRQAGLDPDF
jgi:hypothetical protein